MENIEAFAEQIYNSYKLKFTYRYTNRTFNGEKDSTAAHSWNMMILADFFLNYLEEQSPGKYNLDKLKIYEYIMYHDLVEAEVGDVDLGPKFVEARKSKELIEQEGAIVLSEKLPAYTGKKFISMFNEYEQRKTLESKFVKIIDMLEAEFQCFSEEGMHEGWTGDFFDTARMKKELEYFPELKKVIIQVKESYIKRGFFK